MNVPNDRVILRKITSYLAFKQTYFLGIGAMMSFNAALFLFAALPLSNQVPNPVRLWEVLVPIATAISTFGMVLHAIGNRSPAARWSFLSCVFAIMLTLVAFCLFEPEARLTSRLVVGMFMTTGLFVASFLHIEFGGNNPIREQPESLPKDLL